MPTMFCPDCNADLDSVAVDAPCPDCGRTRREARFGTAQALTATAELGAVSGLFREALDELAAMPADAAREVAGRIVELGGTVTGTASGRGELTVEHRTKTVTADVLVAVARAPAVERLWAELPAGARWALKAYATGVMAAAGMDSYTALREAIHHVAAMLAAAQISSAQPVRADGEAYRSPPAIVQQEPAPAPPLPPLIAPTDAASDGGDLARGKDAYPKPRGPTR